MMKIVTMLGIFLGLIVSLASSARADQCGIPCAEHDRGAIHRILAGPIVNSNSAGIGGALLRMHELALLCSSEVYGTTQRMALENEFIAWRLEIDRIGQTGNGGRFRPRSLAWLDRVVDPAFLGIASLRINGASVDESQRNALVAAEYTARAIQKMWSCY